MAPKKRKLAAVDDDFFAEAGLLDFELEVAALEEESVQEEQGEGAAGQRRGRGRGKGKAKARGKGARVERTQATQDVAATLLEKCCSKCKQTLPKSDFNADQSCCKACFNKERCFKRAVCSQMGETWLAEAEVSDPATVLGLRKPFDQEAKEAAKESKKVNFNVRYHRERLKAESGSSAKGKRRMMWEGAYKDWAKSARGGYLTDSEIAQNWQRWKEDPKHPRDWEGPRGYLQLLIPNYSKSMEDFNTVSFERTVDAEQKLSKTITEEQLQAKIRGLSSGHDTASSALNRTRERMFDSMGSVGGQLDGSAGGMFAGLGLAGSSVQDLLTGDSQRSKPRVGPGDDEQDGDDNEEGDGKDDKGKGPGKLDKRFDVQTAVNKACAHGG